MKEDSEEDFLIENVAQLGIQLVYQVKIIHDHGFIHGDIKPDNILVKKQDGDQNF